MNQNSFAIAQDGEFVNLGEPDQVTYWSKKFNITPEELKTAVRAVGDVPETIAAYLKTDHV